jgi:hypothetical protein
MQFKQRLLRPGKLLCSYENFKSTGRKSLHVKRHSWELVWTHTRVRVNLFNNSVAMSFGFVNDESKNENFTWLQMSEFRKRYAPRVHKIVTDTLVVIQRPMLHPNFTAERGHLLISLEIFFLNRNNITVDVLTHAINYIAYLGKFYT